MSIGREKIKMSSLIFGCIILRNISNVTKVERKESDQAAAIEVVLQLLYRQLIELMLLKEVGFAKVQKNRANILPEPTFQGQGLRMIQSRPLLAMAAMAIVSVAAIRMSKAIIAIEDQDCAKGALCGGLQGSIDGALHSMPREIKTYIFNLRTRGLTTHDGKLKIS